MEGLIITILILFLLAVFLPPLLGIIISKIVRFIKNLIDK
jgi:hypothetical protein